MTVEHPRHIVQFNRTVLETNLSIFSIDFTCVYPGLNNHLTTISVASEAVHQSKVERSALLTQSDLLSVCIVLTCQARCISPYMHPFNTGGQYEHDVENAHVKHAHFPCELPIQYAAINQAADYSKKLALCYLSEALVQLHFIMLSKRGALFFW